MSDLRAQEISAARGSHVASRPYNRRIPDPLRGRINTPGKADGVFRYGCLPFGMTKPPPPHAIGRHSSAPRLVLS